MMKQNLKDYLILILSIFLFSYYIYSNNEIKNNENNVEALIDSLRIEKNKADELEYQKKILITSKKNLKEYNETLFNELKKEKGKVKTIIKTKIKIETDTLYLKSDGILIQKDNYIINFKYDSLNRLILGHTKFTLKDSLLTNIQTTILKNELKLNLVTGIKKNKKNLEIFVRSDDKDVIIENIQGAIIDAPKPKKIGIGVFLGYSTNFKPTVGIGISYNFIRF